MTKENKAVIFLGTCLLILTCVCFSRGKNTLGVCYIIGAFGCGIMLYAGNRKKHDK
jgi:hypothetical protein